MFKFTNSPQQTETIREYEHLRYTPMVLLALVRFSFCGFYASSAYSRAARVIQNLPRFDCM